MIKFHLLSPKLTMLNMFKEPGMGYTKRNICQKKFQRRSDKNS